MLNHKKKFETLANSLSAALKNKSDLFKNITEVLLPPTKNALVSQHIMMSKNAV